VSRLVAPVLVAALVAPFAGAQTIEPNGGAAGGDALYLPRGDIIGVRNIQGGVAGDLNLDLGAGSTATPGNVAVNYDVGRDTLIYDGRKHLLARFGPRGITLYRRPRIVKASVEAGKP
jgi:hypothetical protein